MGVAVVLGATVGCSGDDGAAFDNALAVTNLRASLTAVGEPGDDFNNLPEGCPIADMDGLIALAAEHLAVRADVRSGTDTAYSTAEPQQWLPQVVCHRESQAPDGDTEHAAGIIQVYASLLGGKDYVETLVGAVSDVALRTPVESGDGSVYAYCYGPVLDRWCGADWVSDDSTLIIGVTVYGFQADHGDLVDLVRTVSPGVGRSLAEGGS